MNENFCLLCIWEWYISKEHVFQKRREQFLNIQLDIYWWNDAIQNNTFVHDDNRGKTRSKMHLSHKSERATLLFSTGQITKINDSDLHN